MSTPARCSLSVDISQFPFFLALQREPQMKKIPLNAILGAIAAGDTGNREVRLRPPLQDCSLMNPPAGNLCRKKKDRNPPLTHSHTG